MEVTRRSVEFGPFEIAGQTLNPTLHWYGLIIVIGILVGAIITAWLARKDEEDTEIVWNGLIWVIIAGVIGARLWSVIFPAGDVGEGRELNWDYFTDLDNGPLAIWSGGLSIFGAVLGGIIGGYLFGLRHKLDRLSWFDRAIISLPLAQAIGRWGNYLNEELYGKPTDLPWGIAITNPLPPYTADDRFHPLFLYESILNVILFGGLLYLWLRRRQKFQHGDFLLLYLIGYSVIRFSLEFLRVEIPTVGELNVSQATTFVTALAALLIFLVARRLYPIELLMAQPYKSLPMNLSDVEYEEETDETSLEEGESGGQPKRKIRRKTSQDSIHKSGEWRGVRKSKKGKKKH